MTSNPHAHSDRFAAGAIGTILLAVFGLLYWWLELWAILIPVGIVALIGAVYGLGWGITAVLRVTDDS